jgi:hypothetical protein
MLWRVSHVINTSDWNQNVGDFIENKRENISESMVILRY